MAEIFNGITDELQTISKLADRPEIPAAELKAKFDSDAITLKNAVNKLIELLNATIEDGNLSGQQNKIPTSNAVAQAISIAGGGDMLKSVYDSDGDNIVDDAKRLGGISADQYLKKSGGTMTGELFGQNISPSSNNTYNIGSQTLAWADAYINEVYTNYVAGNNDTLYTKGNLRTFAGYDGLFNLGSSDARWANAYIAENVVVGSPASNTTILTDGSTTNIRPPANDGGRSLCIGISSNLWTVYPKNNNALSLGSSSNTYNNIFASSGTINTSDRNEKNTIESLEKEKAAEFIKGVNPVSYKFNDGTSGRTHYGMVAQDIEELMKSLKMDSKDFAGFIKSPKTKQVETGKDENGDPIYEDKVIEGEYTYGLRYEEFIAPMIATIQYQQQKIEDLTKRIEALEGGK